MTAAVDTARAAFLEALYDRCDGLVELRAFAGKGAPPVGRGAPPVGREFCGVADASAVERFVRAHRAGDVYFAVATRRDATGGKLEDCVHLGAMFTDVDFKTTPEAEARERLGRFPFPPSAIVQSGGGVHAYWFLREPLDLRDSAACVEARGLLRRLAVALGGDLTAAEPARVLRVPGTFNRKPEYGTPRPVVLEILEAPRRYNPSELDEVLAPERSTGPGDRTAPFTLPEEIREGDPGRNQTLWCYGRSLKAKGWKLPRIMAELERVNRERCVPPLPNDELGDVAHNVMTEADRPTFTAGRAAGSVSAPSRRGGAPPREELEPAEYYLVSGGGICRRRRTKEATIVEPLGNFDARVVEEVALDDGAEVSRVFTIAGRLPSGDALPLARVPAARFSSMSWIPEHWGIRAVVNAGMSARDHLRAAIQTLSSDVRRRHVFTHTGWRDVDGRWIYLTASGAIGAPSCEVDLGPDLARYALPPSPDDPVAAMRVSLDLLRAGIAPAAVMVPLFGAIYRAPTAAALPIDVSLWIEGTTGSLKSTIAALALAHFGAFDRLHLPGAWSSTVNQLERRAFLLKDMPFVVDDYAPSGIDARELEMKAGRLLRAAGNGAGRGRLRADLTERPAYPPRGIVIATGEAHPAGQSLLARTIITELSRDSVNLDALTAAQTTAGRLPHAMTGYVAWLASRMPTLGPALAEAFAAIRARAATGGHLRVPEAIAHLYLGLDLSLSYAVEVGACSAQEGDDLRAWAWTTLTEIGDSQGRLILAERPSHRFLRVLLTLVVKGLGVLLDRETEGTGRANLLGWQDAEALYLMPEASWQAVTKFCREAGEVFPIRDERLRRDLAKEGLLLDPDRDRLTAVVRIGPRTRRVLRLDRAEVEEILGETFPPPPVTGVTGGEE